MVCPWQTKVVEQIKQDGDYKETTTTFEDCSGVKCPYYMTRDINYNGIHVTQQCCGRTMQKGT